MRTLLIRYMVDIFDPSAARFKYLYWEKVQPLEGDCTFNPNLSLQPVMRNWTEVAATRRDRFDYDNGCGCGNAKIEDNITQEYRALEPKDLDHGTIQKPKPKPTSATTRKSKPAFNPDEMMDVFKNSFMIFFANQKTTPKINVQNGGSQKKANDDSGATPENPWMSNSPRSSSSDIDIVPSYVTKYMANAKGQKLPTFINDDEVLWENRKQTVPKKFESPYALDKPSRHSARGSRPSGTTSASRALFSQNIAPEVVADELMPELTEAAVTFVEIACRFEKNKGKRVYYNGNLNGLTSQMLRLVINSYQAHLALRVGHDCHLYPAWRSKYLVDLALARDNPLSSLYNMDSELSRSGAVNRVKDEYTLRDKTYVVLNLGNTHWITVVMHMRKKEFQVMDSLYPLEQSVDTVKALRLAIANDFLEANRITPEKYAGMSNWPIKEYPMPQ
ncbi:Pm3-like protein [Hordeum vulgare]|nr:Pm3-like protein [Hordeum vulgare]